MGQGCAAGVHPCPTNGGAPVSSRQQPALSSLRLSALQEELLAKRPVQVDLPTVAEQRPTPLPTSEPFPMTRVANPSHDRARDVRLPRTMEVRAKKQLLECVRSELAAKGGKADYDLLNEVQHYAAEAESVQEDLDAHFIHPHSQLQLIGTQSFFMGRLFHVKSRSVSRAMHVEFPLDSKAPQGARYIGPELRQGDALVFMALLNMCRDYRVGKQVDFDVASMAEALWSTYNGQQRSRLKKSVQRLQRATVEFEGFTVQFVLRFEHPKRGNWSVAMDPDIVTLFRAQRVIWLDFPVWKRLSEGLTTWLYGYVRSQSRLFRWRIDDLRERCGCDAQMKTFREMLCKSLKQLAEAGLVDVGWFLLGEFLHWRLPRAKSRTASKKIEHTRCAEQLPLALVVGRT